MLAFAAGLVPLVRTLARSRTLVLRLWVSRPLIKFPPQFLQHFSQLGFIQLSGSGARQDYGIQRKQLLLLQAKSFARDALYAVAITCVTDMFFGDNQTHARVVKTIGAGEDQKLRMCRSDRCIVEHDAIVRSSEQPQRLAESEVAARMLHALVGCLKLLARRQT